MPETEEQRLERESREKTLIESLNRDSADVPSAPKKQDADFSPITAAQMRGDRVTIKAGTLELSVKPLTRKKVREFMALVSRWPTVLQFAAAVANPSCSGIDYEATALLMTASNLAEHDKEESERARTAAKNGTAYEKQTFDGETTPLDVLSMYTALEAGFDDVLPVICDAAWLMVDGAPGVVWPAPEEELPDGSVLLSDLLDDHLYTVQYVDLLRRLMAANGGFSDSLQARYFLV